LKFVKYDGTAHGYLLILTNKKRPSNIPSMADEIPVATLYVQKGHTVAMTDADFLILTEQGHIGSDRLKEVPEEKTDTSKPILKQHRR
jgi:phosphoribosylcarboxyaminoimidazole (NCAIR) mutase